MTVKVYSSKESYKKKITSTEYKHVKSITEDRFTWMIKITTFSDFEIYLDEKNVYLIETLYKD